MKMKSILLLINLSLCVSFYASNPENGYIKPIKISNGTIKGQQPLSTKNSPILNDSSTLENSGLEDSAVLENSKILDLNDDMESTNKFDSSFWHKNPGFIEKIDDLTKEDIEQIKNLIIQASDLDQTGGLEITDIFPSNYEDLSFEDLKEQLQSTYQFLVLTDKTTHEILALLIYIEYGKLSKKISIQLFLKTKDLDPRYSFLLFPELEKICRKNGVIQISVIPVTDYQKFFYMRNGYKKQNQRLLFNEYIKTLEYR